MYVEVGFKTKRAMKKFYANGGVGAEVGFFYRGIVTGKLINEG